MSFCKFVCIIGNLGDKVCILYVAFETKKSIRIGYYIKKKLTQSWGQISPINWSEKNAIYTFISFYGSPCSDWNVTFYCCRINVVAVTNKHNYLIFVKLLMVETINTHYSGSWRTYQTCAHQPQCNKCYNINFSSQLFLGIVSKWESGILLP